MDLEFCWGFCCNQVSHLLGSQVRILLDNWVINTPLQVYNQPVLLLNVVQSGHGDDILMVMAQ